MFLRGGDFAEAFVLITVSGNAVAVFGFCDASAGVVVAVVLAVVSPSSIACVVIVAGSAESEAVAFV